VTRLATGVLARMKQILLADRVIYAVIAIHAVVAICAIQATGASSAFAYLAYFPIWSFVFLLFFPFVYCTLGLLIVVHRIERRRGTAFRLILSEQRLAHFGAGLVLLCAMMIFQGSLTSVKNAFPAWWGGFPYDTIQAEIDKALHFGRDPWHYLYAAGENDFVRALVEWNYNQAWFLICFSTLFWVAVAYEARAIRTRYFLCYALVWIVIGNVFAGAFLSAGPAFYGHVTGVVARFAEQLAFLEKSGDGMHSAARVQHYLWAFHERGTAGFGSGIAAFPSMHVSLATLNALFLFEFSRRAGLVAFAYVALVVASSVYLAWHYAIDGYAAIILTVAIYAAVRWLTNGAAASAATPVPSWPAQDVAA
jgi:hypothetical protein